MTVEEKVKILLKGVKEHSDTYKIKQKFIKAEQENRRLKVKLGLDPTAPDIHLGHAVVLRKIKQLQDIGCTVVIVIGDFTGAIGDPTGKSKTRRQLSNEEILENSRTYQEQIFKIINRELTQVRYNSEWLGELDFKEVIELASKITVARLLEREDFKNRYSKNAPIGLHEFFYPLMQAYDSVAIEADIELGGTDQTFNILMGRKIQKDYNQEPQITVLMPLLEGIDGVEKMSKSLGNYVGIYEPASVMFEKIMKIPDELIIKYYELCTDMLPSEIDNVRKELEDGRNPRDVKMELAKEIVSLYHNEEETKAAVESFKLAFQKGISPDESPELTININGNIGESIISELVDGGYYKSKSEVRRLFKQNAVSLNGIKVIDPKLIDSIRDYDVMKIGKSKYFKLRIK